jgi:pimeloyl-ACP methyl ester carboxylesterase
MTNETSSGIETRTVATADGRDLCVETAGDPGGRAILVHAGTPNSRHLYRDWITEAAAKGIHLISYDRPGYGGSTPYPGHTVASGADDVRAIAAALGHDRLAIWGISGGGPYALACAALLPDLAVAVGSVASLAPYDPEADFDYFAGMGEFNTEDIKLFLADPEAARRKTHEEWQQSLDTTPEQLAQMLESLLSPVDAAALTGEFAEFLASSQRDGLAPGDQGWWDDSVSHLTDWGFRLSDIQVPVKVWHGHQDHFVPVQHGQWLAAHIPGAQADISENDGHLTMARRIGEVHDWLLGHF